MHMKGNKTYFVMYKNKFYKMIKKNFANYRNFCQQFMRVLVLMNAYKFTGNYYSLR